MSSPTRFPNGLTNVTKDSALGQFGLLDPFSWHQWLDDFSGFDPAGWSITTVELGAGSATEAVENEDGGVLLLTTDDANNDSTSLQWSGVSGASAVATFMFDSTNEIIFKARFKVDDATNSDVVIGLQPVDTTPFAVTDGAYFIKSDGTTDIDFTVEKNNTGSTVSPASTMADDTYIEVGYHYNGSDEIEVFINDQKTGTVSADNIPDDVELTISFGVRNGNANARGLSVDYIYAAKKR